MLGGQTPAHLIDSVSSAGGPDGRRFGLGGRVALRVAFVAAHYRRGRWSTGAVNTRVDRMCSR